MWCLCLTADRQAFTDRAVRCFLRQTYENCRLLIYDTGKVPYRLDRIASGNNIAMIRNTDERKRNIGALRNEAIERIAHWSNNADFIAHWDSDDVSAPGRIEHQMLTAASAGITGYDNLLIWDSRKREAWEYTYKAMFQVLGTSLMYSVELWQRTPFRHFGNDGEDNAFCFSHRRSMEPMNSLTLTAVSVAPMLVAEYHGGNTAPYGKADGVPVIFDQTAAQLTHNRQWRRAHEWDDQIKRFMEEA